MNYILLVAGKGRRLKPLTNNIPKCLFKLDKETTVIERTIEMIKQNDNLANIIIVTGYLQNLVKKTVSSYNVTLIHNPFYKITNSIASLWFAKDYLKGETVIINGDIVVEEKIAKEILCCPVGEDKVLIDSSIKIDGDYNVQISNDKIVVMSKELKSYFGEYAGVTMLTSDGATKLNSKVVSMIEKGHYDQWYENALVQMIFDEDYVLHFKDLSSYQWTEVDTVDDLLEAKRIYAKTSISHSR